MKRKGFDQVEALLERLASLQQSTDESPAALKELLPHAVAELSLILHELQAAEEELSQQNDELQTLHQTLETERERYREFFDFAPDGYLVTDPHGIIKEANYAAANLLQVAPAYLVGKPLLVYIGLDEHPAFLKRLAQLRSQRLPEFPGQTWEVHLKPRQAPFFLTLLTVAPKYNTRGKLVNLRWLLRDMTAAKQAEVALRASEAFNRAILNSLDVHIAVLDKEGIIVAVNEGWERFAKANGDPELLHTGVGVNYLDVCRRASGDLLAQAALAGIEAVLDGSQGIFTLEYPCPSPSESYWFTLYATPLAYEWGGAVVSHVNITERKQVEEEKSRLLEQIRQQREHLRALSQRLAEVQEAERRQLARELHDQVGQKLTALDLNLNIIWARLAETPAGTDLVKARLDDSLALVEETAVTIRNVMATLRPPVLDDYGLVAALRWYGAQLSARAGFTLSVQEDGTGQSRLPGPVENTLFRIAQEALNNAAKHAQAAKVTITLSEKNGLVRMVVADNGRGFKLASVAETNGQPRWGLMTMAERAEAVGGRCWVNSGPAQGTQVMVEIKL
ncbi:MAG: PAS domain S-box protein [Anaerolineales bacterium]|nr:PAS domain S-box protein [Anaerolineales bacterium]